LRLKKLVLLLFVAIGWSLPTAKADTPDPALFELFPDKIGTFRRSGIPNPPENLKQLGLLNPTTDSGVLGGQVEYVGNGGHRLLVEVVRFRQDPAAYSMLSSVRAATTEEKNEIGVGNYGTAGYGNNRQVAFFKGLYFVRITTVTKSPNEAFNDLAKALADSLDKGEGDIPALLKHLPNADQAQKTALFLTHFRNLQNVLPSEAVLSAIETGGDGDAAFVDTGSGKVLLVEYNTPQLAKDNDDRIIAKIKELWQLGQPAPTAYRRVGNYSVFVFNAPDEATAKQLIDQVKYEQVVQWLGTNPHIYKEAEKRYVETTLGVFIAVVKASGYAFVGCLGLGALIGALMFALRRSRRGALEAYSDAGGMLRLNLDELTPQTDPSRLLGPGR
jgi:hypothetical protein